ncbi:MAG: hypothetical protein ACK4MI_14505 [Brevundimonas sp.]|uniref:hypothetical protein n=1 Tax=Brevundimonas sp. TaxID=1871086 RepID=UPI0028D4BCF7|nr:hypothetical protein [uncultured Brevundimonas sp.]
MIRLLGLGAVFALAPLSAAVAQDDPAPAAAQARLDAASTAFEARMEAFGKRAEAISEDESLSERVRGQRIAALWAEYAPDVAAFTAEATRHAGEMAAEALKDIDVDTLVADALNDPEVKQAMEDGVQHGVAAGSGIARNSAWANPDPDQMETYGLIAQYALDQAADAVVSDTVEPPAPPAPPPPPEAPRRPGG